MLANDLKGRRVPLPEQQLETSQEEPLPAVGAAPNGPADSGDVKGITKREIIDIEERAQPRTPVIYKVVRRMGEEELARPAVSLWWSGVAAGLSISFSCSLRRCFKRIFLRRAGLL